MVKQIELTYTPAQTEMFFNTEDVRFLVVTKGRRFGATRGAAHACIEYMLEGKKMLWGDTINSNIDRYYERYFLPALKECDLKFHYQKQQKQLNVEDGYIDFRSADRPENWEGFGYDEIFLNEAGIILKNKYLYTNAVLPMLMDNPKSRLIAAGVPKGKKLKNGEEHPFYTLSKNAEIGMPGYKRLSYSSYDNPLMSPDEIKLLEDEIRRMSPSMVDQEIMGKFVDNIETTLWSPDMLQRAAQMPSLKRIVVANDPSGSVNGDEVGIITAGICSKGNIYVVSDRSGHYTPLQWATVTVNEHLGQTADCIVAERNFGGDMVKANILNVDKFVRVKEVVSTRGKQLRAEPVVSLYEQGKVFHARGLNKLENEMLTWTPGEGKSPNRVDALVFAITELMGKKIENWQA